MKRWITMFMAVVMVFATIGCSAKPAGQPNEKMRPSDLWEWSDQDMNDYFTEKGVYQNKDWVYIQSKEFWQNMPVAGASGYQATDNSYEAVITVLRITDEGAEDMIKEIVESNPHSSSLLNGLVFDAMVGPFAFCYSYSLSDEVREAMKFAIADLAAEMNVTPDFCEE